MREKSTLLSFASSFVVFCNDKKTEEKEDSLKWIKYFSVNIENIGNGVAVGEERIGVNLSE